MENKYLWIYLGILIGFCVAAFARSSYENFLEDDISALRLRCRFYEAIIERQSANVKD